MELTASEGYEGVTVAGLAVVRLDGGVSVLLAKRAYDESDDPAVRETWEFPGGHLQAGEEPFAGAAREFAEEIGAELFPGEVLNGWRSEEGHYQGFVYEATEAPAVDSLPLSSEVQAVGWFTREDVEQLGDALRPEVRNMDWSIIWDVSRNEDDMDGMDGMNENAEPEFDSLTATPGIVYVHGVLAPEEVESGDSRGFKENALTARPLKLPLGWQKYTASGHDKSVTVGSIDRMMRKDGMIHWEGSLMDTPEADEFTALLAHFGRYGVSIDGDKGKVAADGSAGVTWFDAVRISGAVACSIPAFAEAYAALGPHPDMPEDSEEEDSLAASGVAPTDFVGAREAFDRGPGWVTNPKETNRLHDYWTKKGQPGYNKIAWGTPGDFRRAKILIGEKIAANSPDKMRFLNQIIAQWHFDALGYWPGDHARMEKAGNKGTVEASESKPKWEAVLVSSVSGNRARPSLEYFQRHPDTGALVIDPVDANGLRRVYGYAGEWGICHRGIDSKCVELPSDPSGEYAQFQLGATELDTGAMLNTGLITYNVGHRSADKILSQTATQAHFDNLKNAWATVRLGEDERGVWFSGVVLPKVDEDDLIRIQASGQVSGEWKFGSLITLLTVGVPGFPVVRSSAVTDDSGYTLALAASAFSTVDNGADGPCELTPTEKMRVLAQLDAETRFAALKEQYGAVRRWAHGV